MKTISKILFSNKNKSVEISYRNGK